MSKLKLIVKRLVQNSQELGSNDEHMLSRATFDVLYDGKTFSNCTVDLKQTIGAEYEKSPIEVFNLQGYDGANDWQKFCYNFDVFYRGLVGSNASVIRVGPGATVTMTNNVYEIQKIYEYEVDSKPGSAGW